MQLFFAELLKNEPLIAAVNPTNKLQIVLTPFDYWKHIQTILHSHNGCASEKKQHTIIKGLLLREQT